MLLVLCAGVACSGCAPDPAPASAPLNFGDKKAYVRVVNLTAFSMDALIEGHPAAPLETGAAGPYVMRDEAIARISVAAGATLWQGLMMVPAAGMAKSMYLLGRRDFLIVSGEPVSAPTGSAIVQPVNCRKESVRFDVFPAGKRSPAGAYAVAGMAYADSAALPAGEYVVRASTRDGKTTKLNCRLSAGRGYSIVAFTAGGKPRVVVLENRIDDTPKESGAFKTGPVIV